jgi:hypothetical protein
MRHCLLLDKMSSDIEPAHCRQLRSYFSVESSAQETWETVFGEMFGYFGSHLELVWSELIGAECS